MATKQEILDQIAVVRSTVTAERTAAANALAAAEAAGVTALQTLTDAHNADLLAIATAIKGITV